MGVERVDGVTEPTDADLIKAHRDRDAASFDALHSRYRDRLFLYARSRIRDDAILILMAERVGFEPTVPLRRHSLSRRARSAALAPLREVCGAAYYKRVGPAD